MKLIPADTNVLTLSVDDPANPTQSSVVVPGDGGKHVITLRGHGTVSPPKGIQVLSYNADTNAFLGSVFQGVVAPYRFWQVHKFEIGDAARNINPGTTPTTTELVGELNRIFRTQANIEFGALDRGLVNAFDWDKDRDGKMHFAKHWDDPAFVENYEAGPLHNYITQTVDTPPSPLSGQPWTIYLYYVNNFDNDSTEGLTVLGKDHREIPSLVKTNYSQVLGGGVSLTSFMSNLTAHEMGHKLGLPHPPVDRTRLMNYFNPGNALFKAQNIPCRLVMKEWKTANLP